MVFKPRVGITQLVVFASIIAVLGVLSSFAIRGVSRLDEIRDGELLARLTNVASLTSLAAHPDYPIVENGPIFALPGSGPRGYAALVRLSNPGSPSLVAVTFTPDLKVDSVLKVAAGSSRAYDILRATASGNFDASGLLPLSSLEFSRYLAATKLAIAESKGRAPGK